MKNIANSRGTNLLTSTYTSYIKRIPPNGSHHPTKEPKGIKLRIGIHQTKIPEVVVAPASKTYTISITKERMYISGLRKISKKK